MSSKQEKPTLTGQRIRSRKRDEKSKYNPSAFRDQLIAGLLEAGDLESAFKFLEASGSSQTSRGHTIQKADSLDYRRYSEALFDVLITGGLLAPGGSIVDDDAPKNDLSVFSTDGKDEEITAVAEMIRGLIRRYKYLAVLLEDEMTKILKFLKAFSEENRSKLAKCMGFFISMGLCSAKPLSSLLLDTLIRDNVSGPFLLQSLKACLSDSSLSTMAGSIRKAGLDSEVLKFFPNNRQTMQHFREACADIGGMDDIITWQETQQITTIKRKLQANVVEMLESDEAELDAIVADVQEIIETNNMKDVDVSPLLWSAMMSIVEWNKKADQLAEQALKHIRDYYKLLSPFAVSQKSQVALIVRIQNYSYDNQAFLKIFNRICLLLYKADVLGEDAILEWYNRSHSPKGKSLFLSQMKQMVDWLNSAEEESSDESDED